MIDSFLEFSSPRDMLEKAKREFKKMSAHLDTDNIFNFFVTAYHVKDWVENQDKASKADIRKFCNSADFQLCEYICNKGKHLKLTRKVYPFQTRHSRGAVLNGFVFDEVTFNQGEDYSLIAGGREVDFMALAQRLLHNWERFFADNGI